MLVKLSAKSFIIFLALVSITFLISSCNQKQNNSDNLQSLQERTPLDSLHFKSVRFKTQWLHQAQFAGFYVAYEKGFYKDYGINVSIEMGGPDDPSPEALINKNAQFVSMFLTSALQKINQGNQIVNIAQISQKSSFLLVAKKSSGIKEIADINDRKIGIWANDFKEPTLILLNKHKIKANIIPISWTTNVLACDVVDIMNMMVYNEYDIFINTGYEPEELTVFPLSEYGVNIPEDGIYCLRDYYLKNPQLCQDFAEATLQGWIYALNHEEETLSIVLDYLHKAHLPANIPHQRWMLQKVREAVLYKTEQFGKLSEQDYNSSVTMMKNNNILNYFVPYQEFISYADPGQN